MQKKKKKSLVINRSGASGDGKVCATALRFVVWEGGRWKAEGKRESGKRET